MVLQELEQLYVVGSLDKEADEEVDEGLEVQLSRSSDMWLAALDFWTFRAAQMSALAPSLCLAAVSQMFIFASVPHHH